MSHAIAPQDRLESIRDRLAFLSYVVSRNDHFELSGSTLNGLALFLDEVVEDLGAIGEGEEKP